MEDRGVPSTFTVTVFTRHSPHCPKKADRYWKRCNCRKALYIFKAGRDTVESARTRSWEQAERLAQARRDSHDPVHAELRRIKEQEADKLASEKSKNITVAAACDRWIASQKFKNEGTATIYKRAAKRIQIWAEDQGIEDLSDVTADQLDLWRGLWSKTAEKKYNRIDVTSQSHFQGYLKRFLRYAVRIGWLTHNPAQELRPIAKSRKRTEVLNAAQFGELLQAIPRFTKAETGMLHELTKEFRALFLLQRWSGMRLLDCLMLPRTGLVGNNVMTKTKKTGALVDCILPDEAVKALKALSSKRERFLPEFFLWPKGIEKENLSKQWSTFIIEMNHHLSFKNRQGNPMSFHSHMLRDTFAVEMLLAGVPLEDVSRLLTHTSIKTTEDYYGHWVPGRLALLKQRSVDAMRKMGAKIKGK